MTFILYDWRWPLLCSRSGFEALRKARRVVLPVPRLAAIREPSELAAAKSHPLVDRRAIHAHDVGHVLAHLSSLVARSRVRLTDRDAGHAQPQTDCQAVHVRRPAGRDCKRVIPALGDLALVFGAPPRRSDHKTDPFRRCGVAHTQERIYGFRIEFSPGVVRHVTHYASHVMIANRIWHAALGDHSRHRVEQRLGLAPAARL